LYELSCHGSLALGKASRAYIDGACADGACVGGACADGAVTRGTDITSG
jgi:hypothetical protein